MRKEYWVNLLNDEHLEPYQEKYKSHCYYSFWSESVPLWKAIQAFKFFEEKHYTMPVMGWIEDRDTHEIVYQRVFVNTFGFRTSCLEIDWKREYEKLCEKLGIEMEEWKEL